MVSSPGFVSNPCDFRPIQTRFRCGYGCYSLNLATKINSQTHSPKGTPSGIAVRTGFRHSTNPPLALRLFVSLRFQVLFTPLTGVLFTFPSRYLFTIGRQVYLALESGLPRFLPD